MICNAIPQGWEMIYQNAHGLLAAKLATYWEEPSRPARWTETLNAIAQHDNGWQEWEPGEFVHEDGTPRSFLEMEIADTIAQAKRVVTRAWHQSMWTGLLVSRHISYLHEEKRGRCAELDAFLDDVIRWRQEWCQTLQVDQQEAEHAYAFVRWSDSFSLLLCMRRLDEPAEPIVLDGAPDNQPHRIFCREDRTIGVEPWPYDRIEFPVSVDTYQVPRHRFESSDELARELHRTHVEPREWILRR